MHVIFSGVRNKPMEAFIEEHGGKVVTSTSKKLTMVITSLNPTIDRIHDKILLKKMLSQNFLDRV